MSINALLIIFSAAIGLCIGSFLNVAALRGLSGESIVFPPSKCPKCGKKLNWYTNIPVISYIFLLGKCQFCKKPISPQYPIVELANALLYVFAFLNFGISINTLIIWVILSVFILICITDFREHVVLDFHTYILIAAGLLYNIFHLGSISITESILGIAAGYLIFEILARIGTLTVKTRAFGEGDTLIAMGAGALLGWKMLLPAVFLSIVIQAFFAIPALFVKYIKNKNFPGASSLFITVLSIIALRFLNQDSCFYFIWLILICLILAICLFVLIKNIKTRQSEGFYYMPFGPALVFAAFLVFFYSDKILSFLS